MSWLFKKNYVSYTSDISYRHTRSTNYNQLYTPKPNCELFRKSFMYSGAAIWNSLPLHVLFTSSKFVLTIPTQFYISTYQLILLTKGSAISYNLLLLFKMLVDLLITYCVDECRRFRCTVQWEHYQLSVSIEVRHTRTFQKSGPNPQSNANKPICGRLSHAFLVMASVEFRLESSRENRHWMRF